MSYSVVLRFFNECDEQFAAEIIDSPTRSGASKKANHLLRKETFFEPVKKFRIDNYEYWHCYDIAVVDSLKTGETK